MATPTVLELLRDQIREFKDDNHADHREIIDLLKSQNGRIRFLETGYARIKWVTAGTSLAFVAALTGAFFFFRWFVPYAIEQIRAI